MTPQPDDGKTPQSTDVGETTGIVFSKIRPDLLRRILLRAPEASIVSLRGINNRLLQSTLSKSSLWRALCERDNYQPLSIINAASGDAVAVEWKRVWEENRRLEGNWMAGRFTCRLIDDNSPATGLWNGRSDVFMSVRSDSAAKPGMPRGATIYSLERHAVSDTFRLTREAEVDGHSENITCIHRCTEEGGTEWMATGARDASIKLWKNNEPFAMLAGHKGEINSVKMRLKRELASAAEDGMICVYLWPERDGLDRRQPMASLCGHRGPAICVDCDDLWIVSGGLDRSILVWERKSHACRRIEGWHEGAVYSLQFNGCHVISGCEDGWIRVWNAADRAGVPERCWRAHDGGVVCMQLDSRKLVTGSADGSVKAWDWRSGGLLWAVAEEGGGIVWQVHFDRSMLVCSALGGTLSVRDFRPPSKQ